MARRAASIESFEEGVRVKYNADLAIATGRSRFETSWKNKSIRWSSLLRRLSQSVQTGETHAEYMQMPKPEQDKVKDIVDELETIKLEFQKEKALFLADYSAIVQDWIARHPQWETMLANSVPSVDYVSSKLLFGWKSFRFSIAKDSNIAEDVAKLADSVFADIARQASEAYRDVFADRTQLTQRSLGPLRVMETKLSGLQFIEPRVAQAAQLIRTALDEAPDKGPIQGADLSRLLGLVCLLRDAEALEDYTTRMMDGQSASGLLAGLAAPIAVADSAPALPIGSGMRQSAVIASQGLW